jgi:hypothetical protein
MEEKLVMYSAVQYNRYVVNGKLFRTIAHDVAKRSKNSGVCVLSVDGEIYYGKCCTNLLYSQAHKSCAI